MDSSQSEIDEQITRQKLSEQVYDRLWHMIVSGELSPGDSIPSERKLMDRFGVGRPAVREAMQALANKGLITISQGERSRVIQPNASTALGQVDEIAKLLLSSDASNLDQLKQVRKILEVGCVSLVASHCNDKNIAQLTELIEKQRDEIGSPEKFIQADIEFHVAIAGMSGNPLLQAVVRAMLTWLREYYAPMLIWAGREETTLDEHAKLVEYLGAGDALGATLIMREHLDRSDPLYVNSKNSGA